MLMDDALVVAHVEIKVEAVPGSIISVVVSLIEKLAHVSLAVHALMVATLWLEELSLMTCPAPRGAELCLVAGQSVPLFSESRRS